MDIVKAVVDLGIFGVFGVFGGLDSNIKDQD